MCVNGARTGIYVELLGKEWMLEIDCPPSLLDELLRGWDYQTEELVNDTSATARRLLKDTRFDRGRKVRST